MFGATLRFLDHLIAAHIFITILPIHLSHRQLGAASCVSFSCLASQVHLLRPLLVSQVHSTHISERHKRITYRNLLLLQLPLVLLLVLRRFFLQLFLLQPVQLLALLLVLPQLLLQVLQPAQHA